MTSTQNTCLPHRPWRARVALTAGWGCSRSAGMRASLAGGGIGPDVRRRRSAGCEVVVEALEKRRRGRHRGDHRQGRHAIAPDLLSARQRAFEGQSTVFGLIGADHDVAPQDEAGRPPGKSTSRPWRRSLRPLPEGGSRPPEKIIAGKAKKVSIGGNRVGEATFSNCGGGDAPPT